MKAFVLVAALLSSCTPLAAYTMTYPYGKEIFGKDQIAETYKRFDDYDRRMAGYPAERDGVLPVRNAVPRKGREK